MNKHISDTVADYLSVSRINTFLRCPRQYFLKYVERVPPDFRSAALAFGTAWHDAVRHHFASSGARSADELVELFTTSLDTQLAGGGPPVLFDDNETRDDLVGTARAMLGVFLSKVPFPEKVLDLERAFSLELVHPVSGEVLPVPIVGALDAIVLKKGRVFVLEIKSGKRKWSTDQTEWDLQTTTYLSAARSLGYDEPRAELVVTTKTKKPDVQIVEVVRHRRDEEELTELAVGVFGAINAGVDLRQRGWACRSCAWAAGCSP